MRWIGFTLITLLLTQALFAETPTDVDEVEKLRDENKELAQRVRQLEEASLEESIDAYLEQTATAEGAHDTTPNSLRLTVSGHIRLRWEVRHNNYSPTDPNGQRSFDVPFFRVRRAYAEFQKIGGSDLNIEVGRYVMFYGDQRVIGHLEWANVPRTYDGARARIKKENWWLDLFYAKVNRPATAAVVDNDTDFAGVYGGVKIVEAYLLFLSNRNGMAGETGVVADTNFFTLGVRLHDNPGNFDWTVEGQGQFGDVLGDDLTAWGVVLEGGYTFKNSKLKPRIALVAVWATGDENPTDGKREDLQQLFPTNHLHYGYIDFVNWSNIINFEVNFRIQPAAKWFLEVAYHHFRRPESAGAWQNAGAGTIRSGAAGASGHLGDEFDLVATFKPNKSIVLEGGYSVFFPGDFIKQTGASPTSHWFYFMMIVKF